MAFQQGALLHLVCYERRVRRAIANGDLHQRHTKYRGYAVLLRCYRVDDRWRPRATVYPYSEPAARRNFIGLVDLCDSADEALSVALETARTWIDRTRRA